MLVPYQDGQVCTSFIEERVRELEAYLKAAGFEDCELTEEERVALEKLANNDILYHDYRIAKEVFIVANSHNILKSEITFDSGNTPYVTASENNNSVMSYIEYDEHLIEEGNTILIGGKTLVIKYQKQNFFSNDSHNLILKLREDNQRKENIQLYLVASLYKSLSHKYSWGNSISKAKIQGDTIKLPVTSDGSIDYHFMETYINAIKKECIARLKRYIEREHKTYKKIIEA